MKRKMENQVTSKEVKTVQVNFVQQLPKEEPVKPVLKVEDPKPTIGEKVEDPKPTIGEEEVVDLPMNIQEQPAPTRNNVTVIDRLFPF